MREGERGRAKACVLLHREQSERDGGDGGDDATSVDCDSTAAELVSYLTTPATSPLQDKDPHSSTGEMAYEGSVAISAVGSTIKLVTSYDPDDADATLENEIEVE